MQVFIGQIILAGFNFAAYGFALCNGQLLSIAENAALFQLIGTTYGGDGQSTFGLPNLQGRTAIGTGQLQGGTNYQLGQIGGAENVTVAVSTYPTHSHLVYATSGVAGTNNPTGAIFGGGRSIYSTTTIPDLNLNPIMVALSDGGNQAHNNLQPFQVLNWMISLQGFFPSAS
jgi:microcystin-dependent protein